MVLAEYFYIQITDVHTRELYKLQYQALNNRLFNYFTKISAYIPKYPDISQIFSMIFDFPLLLSESLQNVESIDDIRR